MRYLKLLAVLVLIPCLGLAKTLNQSELSTLGTRAFHQKALNICPQAMNYTLKSCDYLEEDGAICLAVLHFDHGFLLMSAEDAVMPVLAYGFENDLDLNDMAPGTELFLTQYRNEIAAVRRLQIPASEHVKSAWQALRNPARATVDNPVAIVPTLIPSRWNQSKYYNYYSPQDENSPAGYDGRTPNGCVAVAMSQIMYYYRFPTSGSGSHTNYTYDYGSFHVNFGQQTYCYEAMCDKLNYFNNEVAKLIFHAATSVDMSYGPTGSGAYSGDVPYAMSTYFKYNPNAYITAKHDYSDSVWSQMLKTELEQRHPLYYSGYSEEGGHAFICDGYNSDGYFHFNFGWGGSGDAYYTVFGGSANNAVNGYSGWQQAIFNLYPRTDLYPNYCNSLISSALNGTLEDGSGYLDYLNNTSCSYVITDQNQYQVRVTVQNLQTEENHDFLRFWAGHPSQDSLLLELSGTQGVGTTYNFNTDSLYITFETDESVTDQGWRLSYESMREGISCGNHTIYDASGTLSDNSGEGNHYRANSNCNWIFRLTDATYIHFVFEEMDISPEDHLDFYDMTVYPYELMASYTGNSIPAPLTLYSNRVKVSFVSDNYLYGDGFKVSWSSSEVGVEDFQCGQPTIYPNPASDVLHVKFEEIVEQGKVSVYDMVGHLLFTQNIERANQLEIPVNQLSSGIYLLSLESQGAEMRRKIVVKH